MYSDGSRSFQDESDVWGTISSWNRQKICMNPLIGLLTVDSLTKHWTACPARDVIVIRLVADRMFWGSDLVTLLVNMRSQLPQYVFVFQSVLQTSSCQWVKKRFLLSSRSAAPVWTRRSQNPHTLKRNRRNSGPVRRRMSPGSPSLWRVKTKMTMKENLSPHSSITDRLNRWRQKLMEWTVEDQNQPGPQVNFCSLRLRTLTTLLNLRLKTEGRAENHRQNRTLWQSKSLSVTWSVKLARNRFSAPNVVKYFVESRVWRHTQGCTQERNPTAALCVIKALLRKEVWTTTRGLTPGRNPSTAQFVVKVSAVRTLCRTTWRTTRERNRTAALTVINVTYGTQIYRFIYDPTQERNPTAVPFAANASPVIQIYRLIWEPTLERNPSAATFVMRGSPGGISSRTTCVVESPQFQELWIITHLHLQEVVHDPILTLLMGQLKPCW